MGHNNAFFLIALLMFATANPLAHAQPSNLIGAQPSNLIGALLGGDGDSDGSLLVGVLTRGNPIPMADVLKSLQTPLIKFLQGLRISGMLCCTPTGSCPAGGEALSEVVVNLNCTSNRSGSSILGQGRTDINGRFNITENSITGKVLNILEELPCQIYVQHVDQAICPILSVLDRAALTALLKPVSLQLVKNFGLILNTVTSLL